MRRVSLITLGTLALAGTALSSEAAQPESLKHQVVGTWTISSWEQVRPGFERFVLNPKGVEVFSADGRFYIMLVRPDLPQIAASDSVDPPGQAKQVAARVVAYSGTYTVSEASKSVTLHVDASSLPSQFGADQVRTVTSLTAAELTYQSTDELSGGQNYVRLKRVTVPPPLLD